MQTTARPADAEILNTEELAKLLDYDKETAAKRIIAGDLPGSKFGRDWIIPRKALIDRINEMAVQDAAARKAALEADRDNALARGQASTATPSPALPTAVKNPPRKGQRRVPPTLPLPPQAALC